jgi:hypothetical protein
VKLRLIVILAIAVLACSKRSSAHVYQPADVKSDAPTQPPGSRATKVTEAALGDPRPSRDDDAVVIDLPFRSLEIDTALAENLRLTSTQIGAIQHLVSQQRREIEPLMTQLQSIHEKLVTAVDQGQSKETELLAATEARVLTKLIIKSARIQARLHNLLTHAQQKRLEDLNRSRLP